MAMTSSRNVKYVGAENMIHVVWNETEFNTQNDNNNSDFIFYNLRNSEKWIFSYTYIFFYKQPIYGACIKDINASHRRESIS